MANFYETNGTAYSSRQRAVSLTLGVACGIPMTTTAVIAHGQAPTPPAAFANHSQAVQHAVSSLVHSTAVHKSSSLLPGSTSQSLNLASSSMSFLAGNLANFSNLTIDVGGRQEQVNLNTKLTGAELVAAQQVLTTGHQSIKLGGNGAADGGTVSLNSSLLTAVDNSLGGSLASLTVAKGVQVVDSLSNFSLSGSLANYGSILTAAGTSGSTDKISAGSILNASSGAISSYTGGGTGASALVAADPSLSAATSITNNGTISSVGNLTVSAPVVNNLAGHGSPAVMTAANNVNINTQSLNNSGTISALSGNVNVASTAGLTMAGTGGTLQANNGNINLTANNADINVDGGNMLSQQVNFNAGTGNINADLGQVTGVVNATGNNVQVIGNTQTLEVGQIDAIGDPLVASTGSVGLTGGTGGGTDLTVISGANIFSAGGALTTAGVGVGGAGGNLTLIAGAKFTGTQAAGVTVTGGSSTGGNVDLTGGSGGSAPVTSITTNGITGGAAGNIQMIAYAGSVKGSGNVLTPAGITMTALGNAGGANGTVTIISGAKTGTAVSMGGIDAGTVNVDVSTPTITAAKGTTGVAFAADGTQGTNTFGPAKTGNVANITLGNVTNATGVLNILTGGSATVANTGATVLDVGNVTVGKTGSFNASTGTGIVDVTGTITGGTANITTGAAGTDILVTNVSNLFLNTANGVNDTQGITTMNLGGTLGGAGTSSCVTSSGQLNANTALFDTGAGNSLTLATTATDKGGINIGAPIQMGTTGTVAVNNLGTGKLTETKGITLAAETVSVNSNTSFGSKSLPFLTSATGNLNVVLSGTKAAKNIGYVSDTNVGPVTFNGNNAVPAGGSLFLTSASSKLSVANANFNIVSITDTRANANGVDFSSAGGTLGLSANPKGSSFTVVSASNITDSSGVTVNGATITLNATGSQVATGGVGKAGIAVGDAVVVNSPNLVLNSAQGNVYVTDSAVTTVSGAASLLGTFSVTDTKLIATPPGGLALTVGKSIAGGFIVLTTAPGSGSISTKGTVGTSTTQAITLNSATSITTSSVISGNDITLTSDGTLTTTKAITGTGPGSIVTLDGSSATATGNAVVIGGAVTGDNIIIGLTPGAAPLGQGNIAINAAVGSVAAQNVSISANASKAGGVGGSITGTGLVTGTDVSLSAANSIGTSTKSVATAAANLSVASGTASTDGAFIAQKGNVSLGTSTDNNLVVKVTGNLDVTGIVTSPNLALTSSGTTTVDGTISNGGTLTTPTSGTMTITSGGAFTISPTGSIVTVNDTKPVTVKVTGLSTINGTVAVQTFDLNTTTGLNVGASGVLNDGADNITTSGPVVVDGSIGTKILPANFNITTTGAFTFGPGSQVNGGGTLKAASITNYATLTGNGNVNMTATGTGNAFSNFGTISGLDITLTTTSSGGIIFNAPGGIIIATQPALQVGAPTINFDSYNVNNQGTVSALGLVEKFQGTLNFTSPGALTISGPTGAFAMNYFGAVNLKAGGNIVVGGVVNGATSNPFSNFNAANNLGNFTVNTTGTFSSPMSGVSVETNTTGTFGGLIAITASNVLYNGVGTLSGPFALVAIGAGPLLSGGAPITLDLSTTKGITIGSLVGDYSVQVEGYKNTALTTISTAGPLVVNTAPAAFDVNYTSLALTGNSRVLIQGNLDEGTLKGTSVTITTLSSSPFLIGGAVLNTGNGQNGLTINGQGISADTLTINAPGVVTLGTTNGAIQAELTGITAVNLNSQSLIVNFKSDVSSLALSLNNVNASNTAYTNLSPNGFLSASAINISDPQGTVTLSSGTTQTVLGVGTTPNGPAASGVQLGGGTFSINAQSLSFGSGGLLFNATGGIDGGVVTITLGGPSSGTGNNTVTVGKGNGQIQANVAGTNGAFQPTGTGEFELTNAGNIVVDGINANPALSSINVGPVAGRLSFVADGPGTAGAGSTVLVDGTNISGLGLNLFNISTNSTAPLLVQGASAHGGNGITGGSVATPLVLVGGNLTFSNLNNVVTNGAFLTGSTIVLQSGTEIDASKNSSFAVGPSGPINQTTGGVITFSAPTILVAPTGLNLIAAGGNLSGGNITVTTTTTPIKVASTGTGTTSGSISFDVGNMEQNTAGQNVAGIVTITSPGNLAVNATQLGGATNNAIVYADGGFQPGVGGTLTFNTTNTSLGGATGGVPGTLTLTGAAGIIGLNFSTVVFNANSSSAFALSAAANGNGIVAGTAGAGILTAGAVTVNAPNGSINTVLETLVTHAITLTAPLITFGSQTITVLPDNGVVGITGVPGKLPPPTGDGGLISINAPAFAFASAGGVFFSAEGAGAASLSPNSTGGSITITDTATGPLSINSKTFAGFDVSNANGGAAVPAGNGQTAGSVTLTNTGNIIIVASAPTDITANGSVFTYGATGGSFTATAPNIQITGIAALSDANQQSTAAPLPTAGYGLASITLTTDSATPFTVSGATASAAGGNGFVDATPTLVASAITISNTFATATKGGINFASGDNVQANVLTLKTPGAVTFDAGEVVTALLSVVPVTIPAPPPPPVVPPTIIPAGTGGAISITAGSIVVTNGATGGPVTFNAIGNTPASAPGSGGTITIAVSGTGALNIGSASGQSNLAFNVSNVKTNVAGDLAGSVTVTNGGNIIVDGSGFTFSPTNLATTGSGSLSLTGTNLNISNINLLNTTTPVLNSISLTSTSSSDFLFANAANSATVPIGNGFVGAGANLVVATATINANITGTLTGGINASGATGVTANSLTLNTLNTLTLTSGAGLIVSPNATTGAGGNMTLTFGNLAYTGLSGATLIAAGAAGGNGGVITVTDKSAAPLSLGLIGPGGLAFDVGSVAGQQAGTVSVTSSGTLNVDCRAFTFGPSEPPTGSGNLSLTGPNVLIGHVAALDGANGYLTSLVISSSSNSDFVFGGATVNGFTDLNAATLTALGITINANTSGALAGGLNLVGTGVNVTTLSANIINLNTLNTITLPSTGNLMAFANPTTNAGGTIAVTAGAININGAGGFTFNAFAPVAGGAGGSVTITDAGTAPITVGATGFIFNVANAGGDAGGTVSVTNGGAISANGTSIGFGGGFAAGAGPNLTLNANGVLAFTNAGAAIDPEMATLTLSSDSQQAFVLGGAAAGTNGITDTAPGLDLTALKLTLNNSGGGIDEGTAVGLNGATSMTLTASTFLGTGSGAPLILDSVLGNGNLLVTLAAGGNAFIDVTDTGVTNISAATIMGLGGLVVNASGASLGIGVTGTVTGFTPTNVLASNIAVTYASATPNNTNTVTLGGLNAFDGSIGVTSNAQSMTLIILSVLNAYGLNGNITLDNQNTNPGSNITFTPGFSTPGVGSAPAVVTPGATLHAAGPSPALGDGNVSIFMGPAGYTPAAGNTPAGVVPIVNGGGAIFFGSSINTSGSITVPSPLLTSLQALGRTLSFNTATLPSSAINVGAYVTITADPTGSSSLNPQTSANVLTVPMALNAGAIGGTLVSPTSSGATTVTAPSFAASGGSLNALTVVQPALDVSSGFNNPGVSAPGFSIAGIGNAAVTSSTLANPGITSGLSAGSLSSTASNATAQTQSGNVTEDEVSNANRASIGNSNAAAAIRTLTGGVSNTSHRVMDRGPILLSPLEDQVVETPFGSVSVAAHSVALIVSSDNGLAVYNLHDTHKDAVVIKSGARAVSVLPGRSAVLTKSLKSFEEVNPAPFVTYRRVAGEDVAGAGKLYQAEFDIASVVCGLPAVKHLMASDNAPTRKAMGSMLKTAVILSQLGQASEPYSLYITPDLTASAAAAQR